MSGESAEPTSAGPAGGDREGVFARWAGGSFGKLLLPGIVLQSVLIGGGYATGREIVAYGAKFGRGGWIAVAAIFAGFTVMAALTFEVARVFRAYEYKGFIRRVIGHAWPAFDALYVVMAVVVIAVMASAAANIVERTLGVPGPATTLTVVLAVGGLSYRGARAIEAFKSVGTALLYLAFLLFGGLVLAERGGEVAAVLAGAASPGAGPGAEASAAVGAARGAGPVEVLGTGALYVGYNLAVFPPVLFTLRRQSRRRETLVAALVAGLLMTLPFALTWLCLLGFYPSAAVFDAPVPWLPMLEAAGGPAAVVVYGVVMGWTLLETSVGMIHAIVDRIDAGLERRPAPGGGDREGGQDGPDPGHGDDGADGAAPRDGAGGGSEAAGGLSRLQSGLLAAGVLAGAAALSRVGIVALVAKGYTYMAYAFIAVFALPLLTVGLWRVTRRGTGRRRGRG